MQRMDGQHSDGVAASRMQWQGDLKEGQLLCQHLGLGIPSGRHSSVLQRMFNITVHLVYFGRCTYMPVALLCSSPVDPLAALLHLIHLHVCL